MHTLLIVEDEELVRKGIKMFVPFEMDSRLPYPNWRVVPSDYFVYTKRYRDILCTVSYEVI